MVHIEDYLSTNSKYSSLRLMVYQLSWVTHTIAILVVLVWAMGCVFGKTFDIGQPMGLIGIMYGIAYGSKVGQKAIEVKNKVDVEKDASSVETPVNG